MILTRRGSPHTNRYRSSPTPYHSAQTISHSDPRGTTERDRHQTSITDPHNGPSQNSQTAHTSKKIQNIRPPTFYPHTPVKAHHRPPPYCPQSPYGSPQTPKSLPTDHTTTTTPLTSTADPLPGPVLTISPLSAHPSAIPASDPRIRTDLSVASAAVVKAPETTSALVAPPGHRTLIAQA